MKGIKRICQKFDAKVLQQLYKKISDENNGVVNKDVFPISLVQAIYDAVSGERLDSILSKFNFIDLDYLGTEAATRNSVPILYRRPGLIITYVDYDNNTHLEQYIKDEINDNTWIEDSSWATPFTEGNFIVNVTDEQLDIVTENVANSEIVTNKINNKVEEYVNPLLEEKVDKVEGKQLSTNDLTNELKAKLESLYNYNDTELRNKIDTLTTNFNTLLNNNPTKAIENFNEIIAFLANIEDSETLEGIIAGIETQIAQINVNIDNILDDVVTDLNNSINEVKNSIDEVNESKVDKTEFEKYTDDNNKAIDILDGEITDLRKNKVDKEEGKGLSANDFTDEYKEKIDNLGDNITESVAGKVDKTEYDKYVSDNNHVIDVLDAEITELRKNKVDKVEGKQLSTEDFTTELKNKLLSLNNFDDSELDAKIEQLKETLDTILDADNTTAVIDTFQEVEAFLAGITNTQTLTGMLQEMKSEIVSLVEDKTVIEFTIDSAKYDEIINTTDGLINTLNAFAANVGLTRTKYKAIANNIKFIRLTKSDGSSSTIFNVVFNMPKLTNPVICCYGFNKLNDTQLGIGYATISYTSETAIKITSIRSTMYIDGNAPKYIIANGTSSQFLKGDGSLDDKTYWDSEQLKVRVQSGGAQRHLPIYNYDGTKAGGIACYYDDGVFQHISLGWGESPWNGSSSLTVGQDRFTYKNYKVWYEGNDGADSGLDADMLDGLHASNFARGGVVTYKAGDGVSDTSGSAGWKRIATATNYNGYGVISLNNTYWDNASTSVTFLVQLGYTLGRCVLTQIGGSKEGCFPKVRIIYPNNNSGNIYIEVYYNSLSGRNNFNISLANSYNISLLTTFTEGNIPSGYTAKEFVFTNGISAPTFLGELDGKLIPKQLTNENLNDLKESFNIYYANANNTCTNKPSNINGFSLVVYKSAGSYIIQEIHTEHSIIKRYYNGSTWSAWINMLSENSLYKGKEITTATSDDRPFTPLGMKTWTEKTFPKAVTITQAEYDKLTTKDANTLYCIPE